LKLSQDRKSKLFYGYIIVGAGFVISLVMWGTYNTFGIFLKPLISEFGWTRATTSGAFSLVYLLFGLLSIVAGRFTDKPGPKIVLVICGLFIGAGYLLMSQVNSVWQLYVFYGLLMGSGLGGADAPILTTVARWFVKRRGMLTGIAKAGAGVGIFIIPPLANWLIFNYGWRSAYLIIGALSLVGLVSAGLLLKRDPGQIGQLPYGAVKPEEAESDVEGYQYSLREIMSTRQFWTLASVWVLLLFCVQAVVAHIAPHVTDLGISATVAASVVSTWGAASILGRIGLGSISDRLGSKSAFLIALFFLTSSLVLLQFVDEAWMFYVFAVLYGTGHGAVFTVISPLLAELFGLRSLGATFGVVLFMGTISGASSPVLAGRIYDVTGSYRLAFLICLAFSIMAIILTLTLKPTNREHLQEISD